METNATLLVLPVSSNAVESALLNRAGAWLIPPLNASQLVVVPLSQRVGLTESVPVQVSGLGPSNKTNTMRELATSLETEPMVLVLGTSPSTKFIPAPAMA